MKIIYHLPALTNIGMFKQASSMLYGIVTDPSGKPLANVKVKANNTETITDPNGVCIYSKAQFWKETFSF